MVGGGRREHGGPSSVVSPRVRHFSYQHLDLIRLVCNLPSQLAHKSGRAARVHTVRNLNWRSRGGGSGRSGSIAQAPERSLPLAAEVGGKTRIF